MGAEERTGKGPASHVRRTCPGKWSSVLTLFLGRHPPREMTRVRENRGGRSQKSTLEYAEVELGRRCGRMGVCEPVRWGKAWARPRETMSVCRHAGEVHRGPTLGTRGVPSW